jgi:hypothetical protein
MGRKVRLSQEGVEYRIADWKRNTSPFSDSEGRKRPHFWPLLPNQYRLHAKKELTKQAFQAKYSLTLRPMTPYVAIPHATIAEIQRIATLGDLFDAEKVVGILGRLHQAGGGEPQPLSSETIRTICRNIEAAVWKQEQEWEP